MIATQTLEEIIGYDLMCEVCQALGGERMYIPLAPSTESRDHRIRQEFDYVLTLRGEHHDGYMGLYRALSRKYGLSERQIRRILVD